MSERDQEAALRELLQEAFGLSRQEEDQFWQTFIARQAVETQSWDVFTTVMTGMNRRLQPAMDWLFWPHRGLPILIG